VINKEKRTFFKMHFEDSSFEEKFLIDHAKKNTKNFRMSMSLGIITVLAYSIVDYWSLPINVAFGIKLRFFFAAPILIAFVLSSFHKNFYKYIDYAIIACGVIAVLTIAIISGHANKNEIAYDDYYAGISLVNIWIATYARAKFKPALITVIINNLIYLSLALFFQDYLTSTDPNRINILYANLSFIISTNIISLLGCRESEVYARNEFLQNELILQEQVKLIDASRLAAVGEMAAGIAHEINNPLSIIVTGVHSIEKRIDDNIIDQEHLTKTLNKLSTASTRISRIIKSLKTFSRDGSLDDLQIESIKNLINDSIYFCQEKFMHSGVNLTINEIPNIKIKCKSTQISQVLVNLLNNAFDAVIDFPNPLVEISFQIKNDNFIYISIKDSGPGIPEEIREKIMNPFYTTKPIGKGTGLGLSLSKEIIEQHGGALYLEPDSKITIFTFSLPIT
jgi:signal transduction histidine kinase